MSHLRFDTQAYRPSIVFFNAEYWGIANIFARNTDWPGANIDFWRLQTPGYRPDAPYGHDGRWRWLMIDMDFSFGFVGGATAYTHDTLSFATAPGGTEHPNPAWSTFLLRSFLQNQTFREGFINRFADQLNSAFGSDRVIALIDAFQHRIAPEMPEHVRRWRRPASMDGWNGSVNRMRTFAQHRPDYQRLHIVDHFGLAGQYTLTLDVPAAAGGRLRVNTIDLCPQRTPGVPDPAHPWSGIYFLGVPVTVAAIPEPGYHLDGWSDLPAGERPLERTLDPAGDLSLTARFEPIPQPELLHYWSFNTPTLPPLPDHTQGGGTLMLALGPDTGTLRREHTRGDSGDGDRFTSTGDANGELSRERETEREDPTRQPFASPFASTGLRVERGKL